VQGYAVTCFECLTDIKYASSNILLYQPLNSLLFNLPKELLVPYIEHFFAATTKQNDVARHVIVLQQITYCLI